MADSDVILGAINLNDGDHYFVDNYGFSLGNKQTVWDEVTSYAPGPNVQVNVRRTSLIPVTIPMRVHGTSLNELESKLDALWVEVDAATNTLTAGGDSYDVVYSTRPDTIERDPMFQLGYDAHFTLVMMRKP